MMVHHSSTHRCHSIDRYCSAHHHTGFTLIELMIVVAVIGVLSSIAIPSYTQYIQKSEMASGFATLKALVTPAELYYQQHGSLPKDDALNELGTTKGASPLGTIAIANNALSFKFGTGSSINDAMITLTRRDQGWGCTVNMSHPNKNALSEIIPKGCSPHHQARKGN